MTDPTTGPDTEGTEDRARPVRRSRGIFITVLAGCALFAYLFDLVTKQLVLANMTEGQTIPVLPPLLSWHFIRNSGAAFSIGEGHTWIFTVVVAVVCAVVLVWPARRVRSVWWSIAWGLLLGGALGNLTDRLFREPAFGVGHVVDFIALPNFAIFNVADSAVVGAVILICILTFAGVGMDGRRHRGDNPTRDSGTGPNTEQRGPEGHGTPFAGHGH